MALEGYLADDTVFVIAEIGTAHGGDLGKARELVDAAADAGADCVKTQIVYADELVHPHTGLVELPGGAVPLYERFRALEVKPRFYETLAQSCADRGVVFLTSCFGERSLGDLRRMGAEVVKIASPEINHTPLLHAVADAGLEALVSTGVSSLADIEGALSILGKERSAILHCVTAYPAPEADYNLRLIENLGRLFGVKVGVSDHSVDPIFVPTVAVAMGAVAIEKHVTLSRRDKGLDDAIALEPAAFADMVVAIREAQAQRPPVEALAQRFGEDRLRRVLGDGVKRLAPSEAQNYGRSNRSIMAIRDIAPGEVIGPENAAILRSEKNLTPGLAPAHWDTIQGARATVRINDGEGIRWEQLLG